MLLYRFTTIPSYYLFKLSTCMIKPLLPSICQRKSSTSSSRIKIFGSHLELQLGSSNLNVEFDYMWLRDHCRCHTCYNIATHQRSSSLLDIPKDIKPLTCDMDASSLKIKWYDGHESSYDVNWLQETLDPKSQQQALNSLNNIRQLWTENAPPVVPQVQYESLLSGKTGVLTAVLSILEHGVVTITQVPPIIQATQNAVESIAPIQHTFFGDMWEFGTASLNEDTVHEDTAYTKDALDPHNDATYFNESVGLQVFHCLGRSQNNKGGETILVDGMAAVNKLAIHYPEAFNILSTVPIESEYKEAGKHYMCLKPIIVLDSNKQIQQLRFNLYDRAPMRTISNVTHIRKYYEALRKLTEIILGDSFITKIQLSPGSVLILDNWRILHGRTAFSGNRHMGGCYVARSDWLSKARTLGLLL